jgi:hypothetical protein
MVEDISTTTSTAAGIFHMRTPDRTAAQQASVNNSQITVTGQRERPHPRAEFTLAYPGRMSCRLEVF